MERLYSLKGFLIWNTWYFNTVEYLKNIFTAILGLLLTTITWSYENLNKTFNNVCKYIILYSLGLVCLLWYVWQQSWKTTTILSLSIFIEITTLRQQKRSKYFEFPRLTNLTCWLQNGSLMQFNKNPSKCD